MLCWVTTGLSFPWIHLYFHLWPQHYWLTLPYQQGSKGTGEAFSCIFVHLVTSNLQLLERTCRVAFSRRSHRQQGQCLACCSVSSPSGSAPSHMLLRQGNVTLEKKLLSLSCPEHRGCLQRAASPQPAFGVVQAKDFTHEQNILMLRQRSLSFSFTITMEHLKKVIMKED